MQTSPGFWLASSVIFTVNALVSAARGDWVMAVLEALTGMLASGAALVEPSGPSRDAAGGASPPPGRPAR